MQKSDICILLVNSRHAVTILSINPVAKVFPAQDQYHITGIKLGETGGGGKALSHLFHAVSHKPTGTNYFGVVMFFLCLFITASSYHPVYGPVFKKAIMPQHVPL